MYPVIVNVSGAGLAADTAPVAMMSKTNDGQQQDEFFHGEPPCSAEIVFFGRAWRGQADCITMQVWSDNFWII